jgi:hypothetical protein
MEQMAEMMIRSKKNGYPSIPPSVEAAQSSPESEGVEAKAHDGLENSQRGAPSTGGMQSDKKEEELLKAATSYFSGK